MAIPGVFPCGPQLTGNVRCQRQPRTNPKTNTQTNTTKDKTQPRTTPKNPQGPEQRARPSSTSATPVPHVSAGPPNASSRAVHGCSAGASPPLYRWEGHRAGDCALAGGRRGAEGVPPSRAVPVPHLTSQWSGRPTAPALWSFLALLAVGRRSPGAFGSRLHTR